MRHLSRPVAMAVSVVLTLLTLAGCSSMNRPMSADEAAAVAHQLSSGDISGTLSVGSQKQLEIVLQGMGDLRPQVTVLSTTEDGDSARSTLQVTWPLSGGAWTYTTTLHLNRTGSLWQGEWSPTLVHPRLSDTTRMVLQTRWPDRADITDEQGGALMTRRPVRRIGINKPDLPKAQWTKSATALASRLKINATTYLAKVEAAGDQAFVEAITLRTGSDQPAVRVSDIPGVLEIDDRAVLAPSRTFALGILGTVGPATAEQVAKSKGALRPGDVVGQSGLQQRYDTQLRGRSGHTVLIRPRSGEASTAGPGDAKGEVVHQVEPQPGTPLRTTLSADAQTLAERILSTQKPASALVAIDPQTGHVIAAATGAANASTADATVGRYPPGSTFKAVTALALLRSGMTVDSEVNCTATVTVDGRRFKNYNDFPSHRVGRMSLRDAIATSCNTALIAEHGRIDGRALRDAAASLGLGQDMDAGLPAFFGSAPDPKNTVGLAESMIGQGLIEASPMAMATVAASIQAGRTVRPVLLPDHATTAPTAAPLTENEVAQLRSMLEAVVTEGSGTVLAGEATGAKTGTAEYGTATPPRTHAWMIAYDDTLAVSAMVADGDSGSGVAGPLLKQFLS